MVYKQLSTPKRREMYSLLIEWDTKRVGLLLWSDSQDLCSSFGLQADKTEVLLAVVVEYFDSAVARYGRLLLV